MQENLKSNNFKSLKSYDENPLHYAIMTHQIEIVKLIVENTKPGNKIANFHL